MIVFLNFDKKSLENLNINFPRSFSILLKIIEFKNELPIYELSEKSYFRYLIKLQFDNLY